MFLIHTTQAPAKHTFVQKAQGQEIAGLKRENQELKRHLETLMRLMDAKGILAAEELEAALRTVTPLVRS
jgi:hypothetical protein